MFKWIGRKYRLGLALSLVSISFQGLDYTLSLRMQSVKCLSDGLVAFRALLKLFLTGLVKVSHIFHQDSQIRAISKGRLMQLCILHVARKVSEKTSRTNLELLLVKLGQVRFFLCKGVHATAQASQIMAQVVETRDFSFGSHCVLCNSTGSHPSSMRKKRCGSGSLFSIVWKKSEKRNSLSLITLRKMVEKHMHHQQRNVYLLLLIKGRIFLALSTNSLKKVLESLSVSEAKSSP